MDDVILVMPRLPKQENYPDSHPWVISIQELQQPVLVSCHKLQIFHPMGMTSTSSYPPRMPMKVSNNCMVLILRLSPADQALREN
jgi:hypothetical protein